jgi:hypothetical protein
MKAPVAQAAAEEASPLGCDFLFSGASKSVLLVLLVNDSEYSKSARQ